jgi:hypothetical protein
MPFDANKDALFGGGCYRFGVRPVVSQRKIDAGGFRFIPVNPVAAQVKFLLLFHAPPAARNSSPNRHSSRFSPKARRHVVEFCLPSRSWSAPVFYGIFTLGSRPQTRSFARLSTNDLACLALPIAMQPSSKSSTVTPDFSNSSRGRFDVPDEFAVGEGVSDEIACRGLLQQVVHRRCRRQERNSVI